MPKTECYHTNIYHVLLVVAMRSGGCIHFGGLLAKYSIAVRICFLSLQRWTETQELELGVGGENRGIRKGSETINNLFSAIVFQSICVKLFQVLFQLHVK